MAKKQGLVDPEDLKEKDAGPSRAFSQSSHLRHWADKEENNGDNEFSGELQNRADRYERAGYYLVDRLKRYGEGHDMKHHGEGRKHGSK